MVIASPTAPAAEVVTTLWQRAENGDPDAMVELARRYFRGIDLPPDRAEGAKWLLRAAEAGHRLAQFNAGVMYERGISVPERSFHIDANAATAAQWYSRAAEAGVPLAQHNLAMLYRYGSGVPRDGARAHALLQDAARQGLTASMLTLGDMHRAGEGTPRDLVRALGWYMLGMQVEQRQGQGQPTTLTQTLGERIATTQEQLSPEDRQRAERMATSDMQAMLGAPRPAPAPTDVPVDRAAQISEVQRLLAQLGLYRGEIDGKGGPGTRAAIRNFERQAGIAVSGESSPALADALRRAIEARAAARPPAAPTPPTAAAAAPQAAAEPPKPTAEPSTADRRAQIASTQRLLTEAKLYNGEVDGKTGPATRAAIRSFEKQSGLTETGEATPELIAALQRFVDGRRTATPAAPPQPAAQPVAPQPQAATPPPAAPSASLPEGWPTERREQIVAIQKLLTEARLYNGEIDGKSGPGTRAAIRNFEKQTGTTETGEPSPEVYAALQRRIAAARTGTPAATTPPAAPPAPTPAAASPADVPADRPARIAKIQKLLADMRLFTGEQDGKNGPQTRAAIREFEKQAGLPETGDPTPEVLAALQKQVERPRTQARPQTPAARTGPEPWPAERGLQIGRTQLALQQLGLYGGGIDNQLGKGTRAAIEAFQKESGLPETGEPSQETWEALQRRLAERRAGR